MGGTREYILHMFIYFICFDNNDIYYIGWFASSTMTSLEYDGLKPSVDNRQSRSPFIALNRFQCQVTDSMQRTADVSQHTSNLDAIPFA